MLCVFKHAIGMFTFILDCTMFIYNIHMHYFTPVVHSAYLALVVVYVFNCRVRGWNERGRKERERRGGGGGERVKEREGGGREEIDCGEERGISFQSSGVWY